jgi:hypothetical protein
MVLVLNQVFNDLVLEVPHSERAARIAVTRAGIAYLYPDGAVVTASNRAATREDR